MVMSRRLLSGSISATLMMSLFCLIQMPERVPALILSWVALSLNCSARCPTAGTTHSPSSKVATANTAANCNTMPMMRRRRTPLVLITVSSLWAAN